MWGQIEIGHYRILSTQNEGGLARLLVRHPLGALDGGLTGGCAGNSSILGSRCSKADSYYLKFWVPPTQKTVWVNPEDS